MKSPATLIIEHVLHRHLRKVGLYGVPEVGLDGRILGWTGDLGKGEKAERLGIVDYITISTHGEVRCYEIKVSLADFNSKHRKTFVGDYNYYVMPESLAPRIEDKVPRDIGIIVVDNALEIRTYRKPKRRVPLVAPEAVKEAMFRAACRDADKRQFEVLGKSIDSGWARLAKEDGIVDYRGYKKRLGETECWESHPRILELVREALETQFLPGQCRSCAQKERGTNRDDGMWVCKLTRQDTLEYYRDWMLLCEMHTEIGCSKTVNLTQSESFDTLSPLEMNLLVSALEKAKHEPFFGYIGNAFQLEEDSFKLRSCSYQHIIDVIKDVAKEMFANDISLNETEQADAMKGGGHDEQAD